MARIEGLTIEIGADAKAFQSAIRGMDKDIARTRNSLKQVDRALRFNPGNTDLIKQKQQLLAKQINDTKSKITRLKAEEDKLRSTPGFDENSEDAQRLRREIIKAEDQLKSLERQFSKVASVAGAKMQALGGKMQAVGQKISDLGGKLTKSLTAPILAFSGLAVKAFSDVDKGMDAIVKKTGATGDALNAMKDSAKNLATTIPTDFQTAGDAIGQVSTRFHLTGSELESIAGQFVKFAKLNNTDVTTSVNNVQSAMAAFGVQTKDTGAFLDTLNRVGQKTGADVGQIAQQMTTNAASLKEMGYSASDAATFLGQLSVNGIDSSAVMAGLRKAFAKATKDGKPLKTALSELQDTMKNSDTDTEAYAAALELFGNRAGPALAAAIQDGRLSLDQLGTSLSDNAGNIETTFKNTLDPIDKFKMTLNQLKIAGAEFGSALLARVSPMLDKLRDGISRLTDKFKSLKPEQQDMIIKAAALAAALGPVVTIVGKFTSGLGLIVTKAGGAVNSIASLIAGTASLGTVLGVGVGAFVAITGAAYAYSKASQAAMEKELDFTAEEKEHFNALNDTVSQYEDLRKTRDESVSSVEAEFGVIESLKNEYNGLVDSNGRVKAGYEARADYIKGELASALGIEKSQIDDLIGKNGQLSGAIDQVIATKKAEAIFDANKEVYKQALQNQREAAEKLAPAIADLAKKKEEQAAAEERLRSVQERAQQAADSSGGRVSQDLLNEVSEAQTAYDMLTGKVTKASDEVKKYTGELEKAKTDIAAFDGLQKAIAEKDQDAMNQWISTWTQGIKTRQNATTDELTRQAEQVRKEYELIKQAYDEGELGITEDIVAQAQARSAAADKEAGINREKSVENAKKTKEDVIKATQGTGEAVGKNMSAGERAVASSTAKMKSDVSTNTSAAQKSASANSAKMSRDISSNSTSAKNSATKNMSQAQRNISSSTSAAARSAGSNFRSIGSSATSASSTVKSAFPVNLGQLVHGVMVKIRTAIKNKGDGAKDVDQTVSRVAFARAYDNPMLFTSPTVVPMFGDRGTHAGGEFVYGRDNLFKDIREAVGGTGQTVINVTVDGARDPRQWANEFIDQYKLYTRTV